MQSRRFRGLVVRLAPFAPVGLAASALFLACAGHTVEEARLGALPCDVERVVAKNCRECHASAPAFGAPMPLVAWDDFHAKAVSSPQKSVAELVRARTHDDARPMPQPPRPRLSAADQKILDDWIAAGAPEGKVSCPAVTPEPFDAGKPPVDLPPDCPNVRLRPSVPFTMDAATGDEYVCFGVDIDVPAKQHIIRIAPHIDNSTITHHALVYLSTTTEDPKPHACESFGVTGRRMVYAWAPGGEAFDLPAAAGLPIEGKTHFVVQMHYSNLRHLAGQTDASGVDLCATAALRPNDADVLAVGSTKFSIPPRSTLRVDCSLTVPPATPALHVFRSMPHMHQIGKSIGSETTPAGASSPVSVDRVENWSFGTQPWNPVDVTFRGGDVVHTWCGWENGGDTAVGYGERTSDEMCYHFLMFYPRITSPGWSWDAPIGLESCATSK